MNYLYLDWNVINKIEKSSQLDTDEEEVYYAIEKAILNNQFIVPYSNAHINDLLRGYEKSSDYIDGHLNIIKRLTNNLCIVQYWGNNDMTWHTRDVEEFFYSSHSNSMVSSKSFTELYDFDDTGLSNILYQSLELQKLPPAFKAIYSASPIFSALFAKTKKRMTVLAFCEDIYELSNNAKKDYSLWKSLRSYINQAKANAKQYQNVIKKFEADTTTSTIHLDFDAHVDNMLLDTKTSYNPIFQKITDTYVRLDLKGVRMDDKFSNLIDDSLHVFYGAQCNFFITLDDKCYHKAKATYDKLGIPTIVMKPKEFVESTYFPA